MSLRICLIASEAAPLAKTGGLADVTSALAKHLHQLGHDARLFIPGYSCIDLTGYEVQPVAALQNIALEFGPHRYRFSVSTVRLPGNGASCYLVDCPALYHRAGIYTRDADDHVRFLALTHAAFLSCQHLKWSPQILHCNDWHTAFAPLFLRQTYAWDQIFAGTRSVLTLHNIGYQGVIPATAVADIGLGADTHLLHQEDLRAGFINSLKHGILYADAITTVSPTYAREIRTPEYGMGLEKVLNERSDALTGILNGVDYEHWDPRHDPYLPLAFDEKNLANKAQLKREFLQRLKLPVDARTPLAGIVSRFVSQKGFELLFETLPRILRERDLCLVALGSGEERYEQFFARLQRDFAHRVIYTRGHNDELAHWIEAASDIFLMPSRYEPCGLNQMYSLRYGTIPLVRKTGGLADSVQPYDPKTHQGTGFVFEAFESGSFAEALNAALNLYAQPLHWRELMKNAMRQDFSWGRQVGAYVGLYRRALGMTAVAG